MSNSTPRTRRFGLGLVAALALTGGLAACSSDDDSSATTTTAASTSSTEKTTTTAPGTLITVSDVWAAPAAEGENAKVYLAITGGAAADELVSVSVAGDVAESAALVPDVPVELPATQTVDLTDSGPYIELTGLQQAFELNHAFEVTLTFADEPAQTVQGAVREVDEGIS